MTDSLDFGTNSIKHSSMNTIVSNFFAAIIIDSNSFFDNNSPVGLLGLQRKIHPFFGIFKMNELISVDKFNDLKYEIFELLNFTAVSYS